MVAPGNETCRNVYLEMLNDIALWKRIPAFGSVCPRGAGFSGFLLLGERHPFICRIPVRPVKLVLADFKQEAGSQRRFPKGKSLS